VSDGCVWYFAYGSNMQRATLCGRRGVEPARALAARAAGWRLALDKPPLVAVGEAFASIVPDPHAAVLGVLYELTPADWEHVELTEGVRIGNYRSVTVRAAALAEPALEVDASALASDRRDPTLTPSEATWRAWSPGPRSTGCPPSTWPSCAASRHDPRPPRRRPSARCSRTCCAAGPRGATAAARAGLTVETFETAGGLVTRNVVYWSAEEVAARFRPI